MSRQLIIRADASIAIGSGHIMRCLALAQAWRAAGGVSVFVHAELPTSLERRIRETGDMLAPVSAARGSAADAVQTIALAKAHGAVWIVADGYCFGEAWQRQVKDAGLQLLLVDDYGQAKHYHADVILNQNLGANASWYEKGEPNARLLLGCRYALLRREFLQCQRPRRTFDGPASRVLVSLGGADPDNVTTQVVVALREIQEVEAAVVVGGSNPHLEAIREAMGSGTNLSLVVDATNMPELMAWADVAVTAAGSTSWELAMMGLPALQLVVADNQALIAAAMDRADAAINLGEARAVDPKVIASRLRDLLAAADQRREMSTKAAQLVDGHGASRVVAALGAPLKITLLSDNDSWLNDYLPELKAGFERGGHAVRWIHDPAHLAAGDVALFLSLSRLVAADFRSRHAHNLVVHESALPHGRGWSPLTWQVLEGKQEIPVTLLEAVDAVDAGDIYAQTRIQLQGGELVHELRDVQAAATLQLCRDFVGRYPFSLASARPQLGAASVYPRRQPADSRLDPDKTLREQFNLLRVCDPDRYPAFFELAGRRYEVRTAVSSVETSHSANSRETGFTLLLTGAGGVAAPGLIAHLRSKGVRVLAADMNPKAIGLVHADRGYCIPAAGSPQFLPEMRAICQREKVDVVVPLVDEELMPLQELATSLNILTPRARFIETCLDKHQLSRALAQHSIPGPKTFLASEDFSSLTYPVILKPRTGRGSRGVMRIDSPKEMQSALEAAAWTRNELIVQEYIDGPEFTVSVVVWRDGVVQAVVPKEIIAKKGVTQMAVTRRNPGIERLCRNLQAALRADGPFNVQLRLDPKSGEPLTFEINPRYSTTVTHTMAAGVDELYGLALQAVRGTAAHRFPDDWRENLILRRRSVDEFLSESDYLAEQQSKLCGTRSQQ
jgi:UDP-2,4-diacetamido-2,4,6-trideoxy-beta-L-altropyranose hydrolase